MKCQVNDEPKQNNNELIAYTNNYYQEETNSKLLSLPDYIIEAYIFPYLGWKELFFRVRGTHSYLHEIVKSTWCNIIKEEMCNQLKNLTFLYEKEALSKAYEFKLQYLINYRNLLLVYNLNANILNILEKCLDYISDENVFKLLATFFGILGQEECLNVLFEDNADAENRKNRVIEMLHSEQLNEDFKNKMDIILDLYSIESDSQVFLELNEDFNSLNREHIEEIDENCRLIYSFLQGILEYQNLKKNVQELKVKLEKLYIKIQTETKLWPKRKKFFETAYKILLYSKSTSYKFKYINDLYAKYSIKSPLSEYKEESYISMVELRNQMEKKKIEMINRFNNNTNNLNNGQNLMDEVNDILLKNVLDRRLLLTKKILLTEKFYDLIFDQTSICKKLTNSNSYDINHVIISEEELLKTLLLISHACPEDISINSVLKLFVIKKSLEQEQMKENIDNKGTEIITKNEEINIEKRSEIILLKKQKENLINQKKKTEQMLNVLKKYMQLKENFLKNKQKYKSLLYFLSKLRPQNSNNTQNNNNEENTHENEPNIDAIEELLECKNDEEININLDQISNEEKKELQNFQVSEELLKEIECSLLQKIKQLFQQEKEDDININENTDIQEDKDCININNKNCKIYDIEKGENININGNSVNKNIESEDKK